MPRPSLPSAKKMLSCDLSLRYGKILPCLLKLLSVYFSTEVRLESLTDDPGHYGDEREGASGHTHTHTHTHTYTHTHTHISHTHKQKDAEIAWRGEMGSHCPRWHIWDYVFKRTADGSIDSGERIRWQESVYQMESTAHKSQRILQV